MAINGTRGLVVTVLQCSVRGELRSGVPHCTAVFQSVAALALQLSIIAWLIFWSPGRVRAGTRSVGRVKYGGPQPGHDADAGHRWYVKHTMQTVHASVEGNGYPWMGPIGSDIRQ